VERRSESVVRFGVIVFQGDGPGEVLACLPETATVQRKLTELDVRLPQIRSEVHRKHIAVAGVIPFPLAMVDLSEQEMRFRIIVSEFYCLFQCLLCCIAVITFAMPERKPVKFRRIVDRFRAAFHRSAGAL
jgi:hypothetical protein